MLRDEGYAVEAADSGEACLERLTRDPVDVIVLDVWLPGIDGLVTLSRLRERQVDSQVVMISGHGNIESAVRAIKMGAFDFVEKPLSLEKTVLVVRNALRQRRLEAENRALRAQVDRPATMVGESYVIRQLREQVAMAAPTNGRVLIYGENGTGKELVARTIHPMSRRRSHAFVEVNCAAIPEELIESELFGHVKGAFTGAVADRRGKFEVADGGTLFLDEIGDMSLKTQAKVLRVLQEQVTEPVGSTSRVRVDVRVLAATNKDLPAEIRAGRFRDDLYFRLNVIPVFVPPLRDRQADIPLLAEHFIAEFAREYGRRPKTLDPAAGARLRGVPVAGQRARAAQRDRAADDHDARGDDHGPRSGLPRDRSSRRRDGERRRGPGAGAPRGARSVRAGLHPPGARRRSRATCPGRPRCSASSAATCTGRCAPSASPRRGASRARTTPSRGPGPSRGASAPAPGPTRSAPAAGSARPRR